MAPMKSQILSTKLIKPSTPTPRHLHKLKLSIMDQLIPLTYLNMIFYYSPEERDGAPKKNTKRCCIELEKSLADTLTEFYPLAGRLVVEDLMVDCNDQGVEFFEAKVLCGKFADFVHGGSMADLVDHFLPWDCVAPDPATAPLAAIQINIFDCGGIVVGVRVSHKVADAFSIITFVNAWATANKTTIKKVVTPSFNLGSLFPTSNLMPRNPPSSGRNGSKIVTKRFFFGREAIRSLVAAAGGSVTPGAALAALLWKALIGVARSEHGHLRSSLLVYPINLRGNVEISMPENSFGNFSMLFMERYMPEKGKIKLIDLAGLIGTAVREMDLKRTSTADDVCVMVRESFGEARREKMHNKKVDVHLCASWCGLPLYEADFGWGKPVWVSSSNKYEVLHLIENKCGDGVDAWVSLYEDDMAEFEQDQDILAFT